MAVFGVSDEEHSGSAIIDLISQKFNMVTICISICKFYMKDYLTC
jgi:hypothetical protein